MKIEIEIKLRQFLKFLILAGVFASGLIVNEIFFKSIKISEIADYPLLNKSVVYELGKHYIINFKPLRDEFSKIQNQYKQKTYIYFLYLNNGGWIGINEREKFTAASLIKVPLAISIYKMAEEGKLNLDKEYTIQESDLNEDFGEFYKTALGKTFKIRELVQIMIEQSDNTTQDALFNILSKEGVTNPLNKVYQSFGWQVDFGENINAKTIDLKTLSNMLIALYNAQYLNSENSNRILKYLSNTSFSDKIVAGLPRDIVVSHKIGVAIDYETFSDCGIIYLKDRNYLLCLGSNGSDEESAKKFMTQISTAAYKYIINN